MSDYLDSEQNVSDDIPQKDITYKLMYFRQGRTVSELIDKINENDKTEK